MLVPAELLQLLSVGKISIEGLIPWSSNATLLVTVRDSRREVLAIYKPKRGETPLWDFPQGTLGQREVAAYLVCERLGWGFVPPTVLRDGPYGVGSIQLFVHSQDGEHYFTIRDSQERTSELMRLAAFDVIVNNADRKSGHCLLDRDGRLWAIDNALTFHPEPKLRTVIWDFADQPLPVALLADLHRLSEELLEGTVLTQMLGGLLTPDELHALRRRLRRLARAGRFPLPGPGRPVPWPLL